MKHHRWVILGLLLLLAGSPAARSFDLKGFRLEEQMKAAEFTQCGLQKLNQAELAALDKWVAARIASSAAPAGPAPGLAVSELVSYNTKSGKIHCPTCPSARQCTKNCVSITLEEARKRGGTPCGNCGGRCN